MSLSFSRHVTALRSDTTEPYSWATTAASSVTAGNQYTLRDIHGSLQAYRGGRQEIATVAGNFQRHNIVRFSRVSAAALGIHINRTNGDELACVCEARVYNE
jgi:hypothetical protein